MTDVIINADDVYDLADKIREKTQLARGFRVKDMTDAVSTLHGYISTAQALDPTPAAILTSGFDLSELVQVTSAAKNTNFPHSEPVTVFAVNEFTFTATAALTE